MIVECSKCHTRYDDEYRWTICPHETFAANDGKNNFAHHPESFISSPEPDYPRKPDGTLDIEEISRVVGDRINTDPEFAAQYRRRLKKVINVLLTFKRLVRDED